MDPALKPHPIQTAIDIEESSDGTIKLLSHTEKQGDILKKLKVVADM